MSTWRNRDSQIDNGNCCATSYVHWQLTPADWNWGACDGSDCIVAGVVSIDMYIEFDFYPSALYFMHLLYYNGVVPAFTGNSTIMWRDITNKSDTKAATYSCPASGSEIYCNDVEVSPRTNGNWYYTVTAAGWPPVAELFQSRRWQIITNGTDARFQAYYNEG